MEKERIKEILQVYRPGEGLESDPEVRAALEEAACDPELGEFRKQEEAFDAVFSKSLKNVSPPDSLYESILRQHAGSSQAEDKSTSKVIQWFHPAAFAVAASIVIFLALSFTFFRSPDQQTARLALDEGLLPTANALYASLSPSFRSGNGNDIQDYLRNQGATIPATLPQGFAWDRSFACDIIELDGKRVSMICFKSEDNSNKLHLFTFLRSDFPEESVDSTPYIYKVDKGAGAAWADEEQIHVLYSDNGEENLRQILDI